MEHAIVNKYIVKLSFFDNIKSAKTPFLKFFLRGGTPLGGSYGRKNVMRYGTCHNAQLHSEIEFLK